MNKTFFAWGTICLALAGLLAALGLVLPSEYVTFMIRGQSLLWIPLESCASSAAFRWSTRG